MKKEKTEKDTEKTVAKTAASTSKVVAKKKISKKTLENEPKVKVSKKKSADKSDAASKEKTKSDSNGVFTFSKSTTKNEIIKAFALTSTDTGSPEVQVALLTHQIVNLTAHLQTHKKDSSSRRGIIQSVGKRRRLLEYLKRTDLNRYEVLIQRIGLKK